MAPSGQARRGHASARDASKRMFQPYHATRVPKDVDLHTTSMKGAYEEPVTTLMLRNIPNKYTQGALLQEMEKMGFAGTYDFFYLPMDVHNRSNVGYAFVNFVDPSDAVRCVNTFSNYKFQRYPSKKICAVSPAHLQGFERNVQHFKHRAVMSARDNQYRPIVLRGGGKGDHYHDDSTQYATSESSESSGREIHGNADSVALSAPVSPAPEHGSGLGSESSFQFATKLSFEQAISSLLQQKTHLQASSEVTPLQKSLAMENQPVRKETRNRTTSDGISFFALPEELVSEIESSPTAGQPPQLVNSPYNPFVDTGFGSSSGWLGGTYDATWRPESPKVAW